MPGSLGTQFVNQGFQVYAQPIIGKRLETNLYAKSVLISMIVHNAMIKENDGTTIGRPQVPAVVRGSIIQEPFRQALGGIESYKPVMQLSKVNGGKWMGGRDTMPALTSTNTQDKVFGASEFRWSRYVQPILISETALQRAKNHGANQEVAGAAVLNIVNNSIDIAMNDMWDVLSQAFWTGSPTSQDSDPWDNPAGLNLALTSGTGIYGRIDRTNSANAVWNSNVVTTATNAVFEDIIDQAILDPTHGLGIYGEGVDLVLTTPSIFKAFKAEARAKGPVTAEIVNGHDLPLIGKLGFENQLIRYDDTYITYDPFCPANSVYCLNLRHFTFIPSVDKDFKVAPLIYLPDYSQGALDAYASNIDSQFIFACENPGRQWLFNNVVV